MSATAHPTIAAPPGKATAPPGKATAPPGKATAPPGKATVPPGKATASPGKATVPPGKATASPGPIREEHRVAVSTFALTFKAAMGAVRRLRGRDTHRPGELSYAQCGLLFGLAQRGQLSASELASLADVAPATATQMLDSLVAGGFVERVRGERDRRIVLVSLTVRGSELVAARRSRYEALWTRELEDFSIAELEAATAVLERAEAVFVEIAADADCA